MLMPSTLKTLVQHGANIDADHLMPAQLLELAQIAKQTGAHITVHGTILPSTAVNVAEILGNQVTFVSRRA